MSLRSSTLKTVNFLPPSSRVSVPGMLVDCTEHRALTSEGSSPPYNTQVLHGASSFASPDFDAQGALFSAALLRLPLGRFLDLITPSSSVRIDAGALMHGVEPHQLACMQCQKHAISAATVALKRSGFDAEGLHR